MPWIHLHAGNEGFVKACCVSNITLGNINKEPLVDIWQNDPVKKLRALFLEGKPDSRCSVCINAEAGGKTSIRQETFEKFPSIKPNSIHAGLPVYFDIRFSNVCNFKCRTCWHGASSKWFEDAKVLGNNVGNKALIKNIKNFDVFIENCGVSLLGAEEIYFAGGEPLVTEEHYLLLDWLIKNKKTSIFLRYNTNFSVLNFKNWEVTSLWKKFDKVELQLSIDAMGELGEFIRSGLSWKLFLDNLKKVEPLDNVSLKLAPTVSVLNIHDILPLFLELKLDLYFNILERPFHYNIQSLSVEEKEKVKSSILENKEWKKLGQNVQVKFEEVLSYMEAKDRSNQRLKFHQETKKLDQLRQESYFKVKSL